MKMKSFAMFAVSSLIAASFAYVAPAMAADDTTSSATAMAADDATMMGTQPMQLADAGTSNAMPEPKHDSSAPGAGEGGGQSNDASGTDSSSNMDNGSGASTADQGSPDTATGDDDY